MLPTWVEQHCGWAAAHQFVDLRPAAGGFETVHVRRAGRTPVVATHLSAVPARHFRLARALYYFLCARPGDGDAAVADGAFSGHERSEANAFAAELLAPMARLRTLAPWPVLWTAERIDQAAADLCVSPRVVEHQVENHALGCLSD